MRTVLFLVADSSCPGFIGSTDGGTSLRMPEYSSWAYCIHLCCDASLIVVMGCLFPFLGGSSLIFFRCKFNASDDRQVLVTSSLFLPKFYGSLPHFLLNARWWLKKMGYSIKFARNSLTYCSPSPCLFLEHRKNYKLNPLKLKNYGN